MERTRREALITIAGLTLTACGEIEISPSENEGVPKDSSPAIWTFYPELKNYPVKERGLIKTAVSKTTWINVSDSHFQPEAAREILEYWEGLPQINWSYLISLCLPQSVPVPSQTGLSFLCLKMHLLLYLIRSRISSLTYHQAGIYK